MNNREAYLAAVQMMHKESTDGWNDWDIWQSATKTATDQSAKELQELREVERMRDEEIADLREKHGNCLTEIDELRALVAMQAEALKYAIEDLTIRAKLSEDDSLNIGQGCLDQMQEAISASTSTVAAWEKEKLLPLQSRIEQLETQLSMLVTVAETKDEEIERLKIVAHQLKEVCTKIETAFHGYAIDKLPEILISLSAKLFDNGGILWETTIDQMPARVQSIKEMEPLQKQVAMFNTLLRSIDRSYNDGAWIDWSPITTAIRDTQATAEAFMNEERAKVLEYCAEYFDVLDATFPMTPPQVAASIRRQAAQLRAAKKGGV